MLRRSENTDAKILEHIVSEKNPPGKNVPGRLQKALIDIAKDVGVSVTTVHRSLDRLKAAGVIIVRPPTDKRMPNIIEYVGVMDSDELTLKLLKEMRQAISNVSLAFESVEASYIQLAQKMVAVQQIDPKLLDALAGYEVVQESVLPDGNKLLVLKPKEEEETEE